MKGEICQTGVGTGITLCLHTEHKKAWNFHYSYIEIRSLLLLSHLHLYVFLMNTDTKFILYQKVLWLGHHDL